MPTTALDTKTPIRSIEVKITNTTDLKLTLDSSKTPSGRFSEPPPNVINAGDSGSFTVTNQSQGGEGCAYEVTYAIAGVSGPHALTLKGKNPWLGDPSYTEELSADAVNQKIEKNPREGNGVVATRYVDLSQGHRK